MKRKAPITAFWFIQENNKLIQCSKAEFDKAISEGKSVSYRGYPDRKTERIAEQLESSRMALLAQPDLPAKLRIALTDPRKVIEAQIILVDDPSYWEKESKHPRYQ